MKVKTGKGAISAMVVAAIWSLSLGINLPGLAVTPMLSRLDKIFGNVSELEVQLLTMMPNILIIPFLLIAGRLSMKSHNKIGIVLTSLVIYVVSAVLYFFSNSMTSLIVVSALLGVGCGLLIPFSTGLIADVFTGKYRMKQMGIISAIGNFALVIATFVVGVLADKNWHWPFCVYLIPIVCLALAPWLYRIPKEDLYHIVPESDASDQPNIPRPEKGTDRVFDGFYIKRTLQLLGCYFFFVFCFSSITYYLSFLMSDYHMDTTLVGTITSILFLAMSLGGMCLSYFMRIFRSYTFIAATLAMTVGFLLYLTTHTFVTIAVASILAGVGIGIIQPIMFDKATDTVVHPSQSTMALAVVLAANYASISLNPVIVSLFKAIFGQHSDIFPFVLNLGLLVIASAIVIWKKNAFPFSISESYY